MSPPENFSSPDWTSPDGVRQEYVDTMSIDTRTDFYRRFGEENGRWYRWLFEVMAIEGEARVLDVGCGVGDLWCRNAERFNPAVALVLGDASPSIVQKAAKEVQRFWLVEKAGVMEIENLPLKDESFDLAIAAHVLYHVADRQKALHEIWRILVPGGRIVATTIGPEHLKELSGILEDYDPALKGIRVSPSSLPVDGLAADVGSIFSNPRIYHCKENIIVTDGTALLDFLFATHLRDQLESRMHSLSNYFTNMIRENGPIQLTAHGGAVIGTKK